MEHDDWKLEAYVGAPYFVQKRDMCTNENCAIAWDINYSNLDSHPETINTKLHFLDPSEDAVSVGLRIIDGPANSGVPEGGYPEVNGLVGWLPGQPLPG